MNFIPSKEEEQEINREVNDFVKKIKVGKVYVGGSFAKNTWLPGNRDVDVFVRFKDSKNISDKLEKELKKKFKKVTRVHGSRDYFHVYEKDILFEVVPVKEINKIEDAENITDFSYKHVDFIRKNSNLAMQNDIRKLKLLLKANNLYGAESHIKGFSGYVCELLIVYYKSFDNLIKNVKKWKEVEYIDIKKYYKNKNIGISSINYSKRGPLILIDPIQKDRNAAAAVSKEKFNEFVNLCKKYNGTSKFFTFKKFELGKLKNCIVFEVKPLEGKKDVVGGKLIKALEEIKRIFTSNYYEVVDSGWSWDKDVYFWVKVEKVEKHYGPLIKMDKHAKEFKKKWKNIKKDKIRYYAVIKHRTENDVIKDVLKNKYIKEKVKSIRKT